MADKKPWGGDSKDEILEIIQKGGRPEKDSRIKKEHMDLIEQCWNQDPLKRPCLPDVKVALEKMLSAGAGSPQTQKTALKK